MSPVEPEPTRLTLAGSSDPLTIDLSGPASAFSGAGGVSGAVVTSTGSSTGPPCDERTGTVAGGAATVKSNVCVPSVWGLSAWAIVDAGSVTGAPEASVGTLSCAAAVWSLDFATTWRFGPAVAPS